MIVVKHTIIKRNLMMTILVWCIMSNENREDLIIIRILKGLI